MAANRPGAMPPVRKGLGQHFLSDRGILTRIADALGSTQDDTVVEIGSGRGALTDLLRDRAARVVAIEYDRKLAALLRDRYADDHRIRVVEADVLEVPLADVAGPDFLLVGNVPYYITTPILFHALQPPRARRAVFLVQREVAERMSAGAGERPYGALSVNLQALATVEILFRVPAGAFRPPPRVESAVVRVTPLAQPLVTDAAAAAFGETVQRIFGYRRKQMRRVLRELAGFTAPEAEAVLSQAGVAAGVRPETLTPAQYLAIHQLLPRAR